MAKRRDKVEAAVYSVVDDVSAIQSTLVSEESLELLVAVLNDGLEAVGVVDGVTESRGVDNGQSQLDASLFDFNGGGVQFNGLMCFLCLTVIVSNGQLECNENIFGKGVWIILPTASGITLSG